MVRRCISAAELRRRIDALDALRFKRGLTAEEREEADRLTHRLYMREWRAGTAGTICERRRRQHARQSAQSHGA